MKQFVFLALVFVGLWCGAGFAQENHPDPQDEVVLELAETVSCQHYMAMDKQEKVIVDLLICQQQPEAAEDSEEDETSQVF